MRMQQRGPKRSSGLRNRVTAARRKIQEFPENDVRNRRPSGQYQTSTPPAAAPPRPSPAPFADQKAIRTAPRPKQLHRRRETKYPSSRLRSAPAAPRLSKPPPASHTPTPRSPPAACLPIGWSTQRSTSPAQMASSAIDIPQNAPHPSSPALQLTFPNPRQRPITHQQQMRRRKLCMNLRKRAGSKHPAA